VVQGWATCLNHVSTRTSGQPTLHDPSISRTGRWAIATGSAASLAGKTFTFKAKSTGAGQWESDVTADVAAQ
jgi:hypothetical protein